MTIQDKSMNGASSNLPDAQSVKDKLSSLLSQQPNRYYILKDKKVIEAESLLEWGIFFESKERVVAQDRIKGYYISTVFIGINYSFRPDSDLPLVFETMVFKLEKKGKGTGKKTYLGDEVFCDRYYTYNQAEKAHYELIKEIWVNREIPDDYSDQ